MSRKPIPIRTNDPLATRSRILDAAVELFYRNGYSATSMHDIMSNAQVSSGALHHHYPTKKELGLAVIRERVGARVEEAWIAPVLASASVDEAVVSAFNGVISGLQEGAIAGCPLNNLAVELAFAEPDFRVEIQKIFERWQAALAKRIKDTNLLSDGSATAADEMATLVIASYSGAMTMAKTSQSTAPLTVILELLARLWKPQIRKA